MILAQSRNSKVLESLHNDDVLNTVLNLIQPQRYFTGDSVGYDIEKYNGDSIDYENLLISVPLWASNNLEIDDFSKQATEKLLAWQDDNNEHFWDYNIAEWLDENGFNEQFEKLFNGYTYNDSDYNRLDRDIHYTLFQYDYEYYVCFSIHHGADARTGFSDSIILKVYDDCTFHSSMEIMIFERESDNDYQWYELDDIAQYENGEWILNDSKLPLSIYSYANGQ